MSVNSARLLGKFSTCAVKRLKAAGTMDRAKPFLLLDDARAEGAACAHLYAEPEAVFIARRPDEVAKTLKDARNAQANSGAHLAGYIAYEAGLAMEAKLAPLADSRSGANGPLVWLGLFQTCSEITAKDVPAWLAKHAESTGEIGPLVPQLSTGGYNKSFAAMRDAIMAGDIYQANLTYPLAGSYQGDPLAIYAALRPAAQAGYGGVLFDGSHWLLSLSPELFVTVKSGAVKVKPMKGTRPRDIDATRDQTLADELALSDKDHAENLMIVDLMRNDLSRIADTGSVVVEDPFTVESYPTVHQMVSTVRAQIAPDMEITDLLSAIFPCGSITGAPKIRSMELINNHERDARGAYCGALGRIDPPNDDGNSDAAFNVAIRTLRLTHIENGNGKAVLGVGSAIVADSDAMTERRECEIKAGFARKTSGELRAARVDLIETMLFNPETGIDLLEMHLERIKASAAELGLSFDRHAARNQIHALCFELEQSHKIRLLLARSGEIALQASILPGLSVSPLSCIALPLPVDPSDWRLRHKTSDRSFYNEALNAAHTMNADEAILVRDDGRVTEGSFTNVFVQSGDVLLTPPAGLGLLPGVLRRSLIEQGRAREADLTLDDLTDGFLIGNAVRGLIQASLKP